MQQITSGAKFDEMKFETKAGCFTRMLSMIQNLI